MLHVSGERQGGFCDGISRRDFLTVGGLGVGGLALPQLLRAEEKSKIRGSRKAVIMVILAGGPSHQDMFDLKMDAPSHIRGEFRPISTNVPGIEICEHLPQIARRMDKFAAIRSIVGAHDRHELYQCLSGRPDAKHWPALGSVLSKLEGEGAPGVPPFVGLAIPTKFSNWGEAGNPGFLGASHAPFRPGGDELADMSLHVPLARLHDRRRLMTHFGDLRRHVESEKSFQVVDRFQEQAYGVLTSPKLAEALDIEREDPRVRERYGRGSLKRMMDGSPLYNEHLLMARRLVEAGARCVTLSFGRWDTHSGEMDSGMSNFEILRKRLLPGLDQALTALVDDLHDRGMEKDVTVVAWGEFGRTPVINKGGGRDHWPRVSCALLAGGGMPTGQVIGGTDRLGGEAVDRPVTFQEVMATLYHNLGIDAAVTHLTDQLQRPQFLIDEGHKPLPELALARRSTKP